MTSFSSQLSMRSERVVLGMISKKFVAWYAATILLVQNYINGEAWVMLTLGVFAIQVVQGRFGGYNAVAANAGWNFGNADSQVGNAYNPQPTSDCSRDSVAKHKDLIVDSADV